MKSIKTKLISVFFASLILLAFLAGCSKKTVTVINDPELEQSLYGTWLYATRGDSEFWTGPNTSTEQYLGKATILTENSMSFSENQHFEMSNNTTVESMTLHEDIYITEEELKSKIEKSVSITGSFSVDKDYLELRSESVLVNGKISYTAEEYSKIDSSFGSIVQTQKWKLSGNSLTVSDLSGGTAVSFARQ